MIERHKIKHQTLFLIVHEFWYRHGIHDQPVRYSRGSLTVLFGRQCEVPSVAIPRLSWQSVRQNGQLEDDCRDCHGENYPPASVVESALPCNMQVHRINLVSSRNTETSGLPTMSNKTMLRIDMAGTGTSRAMACEWASFVSC